MKNNDIQDLIERLQGFDGNQLQREMTDGLDEWCRRRQRQTHSAKRVLLIALLLLTTTTIAMTTIPWLRTAWRSAFGTDTPAVSTTPVPQPATVPVAAKQETDSATAHKVAAPQPVDYYYTGIAEDGYSVSYGHDTRTLTYTRYSSNHIISSVIHNAPEPVFSDTTTGTSSPSKVDSISKEAVKSMIKCDFQMVGYGDDMFYYTIIDSALYHVSVRADVAQWMGQPILYGAVLEVPEAVVHDGLRYTVTALADSAFMGHEEIEAIILPATVTQIGEYVFANCISLSDLTIHADVPPVALPESFDRVNARLHLNVPCGSGKFYANDSEWIYFRNLNEDCTASTPAIKVIRKP